MRAADVVQRARSATGKGTLYKLGCGGMRPADLLPWDVGSQCDCSGFAMWALGLSRKQGDTWYGTDEITHDAQHESEPFFTGIAMVDALPGDLLVYAGSEGHHGHVGVVATVGPLGADTVVHCSLGNYKAHGDAIAETSPELFIVRGAIAARCNSLEREVA